jgi:hypothetical protein
VFDVATSEIDAIFDGEFGAGPATPGDHAVIIDTFAELMALAVQDGNDVVIGFNSTTGIYIKNHTIAQLVADDFLFG